MIINKKIFGELESLYVTVLVRNKYDDPTNFTERCKMHAEILDKLQVPFKVQNLVAYAGEKRENWFNYNDIVIKNVLKDLGCILQL